MRKLIATAAIATMIFGAFSGPVEAGKTKKRKVSGTYEAPSAAHGELGGFCEPGCVRFATKSTEKFIQITAVDDSGLPVAVGASHPDGPDDDTFVEPIGDFCGKSPKVAITPGAEVIIFVYAGPTTGALESFGGPPQCLGTATTGVIKGVLSNR